MRKYCGGNYMNYYYKNCAGGGIVILAQTKLVRFLSKRIV